MQDVIDEETFALLTPRGPSLFLTQMAAVLEDPSVLEFWGHVPGLHNARRRLSMEYHRMPAHLSLLHPCCANAYGGDPPGK